MNMSNDDTERKAVRFANFNLGNLFSVTITTKVILPCTY